MRPVLHGIQDLGMLAADKKRSRAEQVCVTGGELGYTGYGFKNASNFSHAPRLNSGLKLCHQQTPPAARPHLLHGPAAQIVKNIYELGWSMIRPNCFWQTWRCLSGGLLLVFCMHV